MGYVSTFIAASEDCPVQVAEIPPRSLNGPSVGAVQYQVLAEQPHSLTQEDVLFETEVRRRWTPQQLEPRRDELREAFSERRRPCLRSSPLVMRHGWGLLFDDQGRVGLVPRESEEYDRLAGGQVAGVQVLQAMRSRRRG